MRRSATVEHPTDAFVPSQRSRVAFALAAGLGAIAPWLALEAATRGVREGRLLPLWSPAVAIPAVLAGAYAGVAAARLCLGAASAPSRLGLVGGATLGFVLGWTLAQPLWRSPTSLAGGAAAVVIVLALSMIAAFGAEAVAARSRR